MSKERKTWSKSEKIEILNKFVEYSAAEFKRVSEESGIEIQNLRNWAKSIGSDKLGKLQVKTRGANKSTNTPEVLITADLLDQLKDSISGEQTKLIESIKSDEKLLTEINERISANNAKLSKLQQDLKKQLGL